MYLINDLIRTCYLEARLFVSFATLNEPVLLNIDSIDSNLL
jgi:hypothetical protein